MKKLPTGIYRDRRGYRAFAHYKDQQRAKRFPLTEKLETIKDWQEETRRALKQRHRADTPLAGTLQAEVERYLKLVASMPTIAQRTDHLQMWLDALGANTPRASVTDHQIRTVLQSWRQAGLAAATCNKRRTALMHLWTVLDGKGAANPVRNVPKFKAADPLPRGRDPHVVDDILKNVRRCRSRAVARVMLWTGMRPEELDRATPDDLDTEHRMVIVKTAKGGRARTIPLTEQALEAWREFDQEDCWQRIPKSSPMNRTIKRWTGIASLRVYDMRHSYGTALARRGARLDVIGSLMGHSTLELTKRYTLAAVTPDALEATDKLGVTVLEPARKSRRFGGG